MSKSAKKTSAPSGDTDHSGRGRHYDTGKPPIELLSPLAILGIAKVLDYGREKYQDAHNWRKGITYAKLLGSLLRHTFRFMAGEDIDQESGLPQVDHIGCCAMFLQEMYHRNNFSVGNMDDRYALYSRDLETVYNQEFNKIEHKSDE